MGNLIKFFSETVSTEKVVQAQRAARCKPRRIHDSQHKKRHRDFSKEVDSFNSGT